MPSSRGFGYSCQSQFVWILPSLSSSPTRLPTSFDPGYFPTVFNFSQCTPVSTPLQILTLVKLATYLWFSGTPISPNSPPPPKHWASITKLHWISHQYCTPRLEGRQQYFSISLLRITRDLTSPHPKPLDYKHPIRFQRISGRVPEAHPAPSHN